MDPPTGGECGRFGGQHGRWEVIAGTYPLPRPSRAIPTPQNHTIPRPSTSCGARRPGTRLSHRSSCEIWCDATRMQRARASPLAPMRRGHKVAATGQNPGSPPNGRSAPCTARVRRQLRRFSQRIDYRWRVLYTGPSAEVVQLVERRLPKPKVAGSRPVFRSRFYGGRPAHTGRPPVCLGMSGEPPA